MEYSFRTFMMLEIWGNRPPKSQWLGLHVVRGTMVIAGHPLLSWLCWSYQKILKRTLLFLMYKLIEHYNLFFKMYFFTPLERFALLPLWFSWFNIKNNTKCTCGILLSSYHPPRTGCQMCQDYGLFQIAVSLKEINVFNLNSIVFLHLLYNPLKNAITQENKSKNPFFCEFQ